MNARICSIASVVAVTVLAYASAATALSVDINCGGVKVGTLSVFDGFPLGAEFKANGPAFPTLADAAYQSLDIFTLHTRALRFVNGPRGEAHIPHLACRAVAPSARYDGG